MTKDNKQAAWKLMVSNIEDIWVRCQEIDNKTNVLDIQKEMICLLGAGIPRDAGYLNPYSDIIIDAIDHLSEETDKYFIFKEKLSLICQLLQITYDRD